MISMTYGHMPTLEQFEAACNAPDEETGRTVAEDGFGFGQDKRVGDDRLTAAELWKELQKAHQEFEGGDEDAGQWCSDVLGCLGFEWV